jgi:ribosome biogenesis GTPase
MNLIDLGWNDFFAKEFGRYEGQELAPARVAQEHKGLYIVFGADGEFKAEITGKMRFNATSRADFPAVGDWVAVAAFNEEKKAIIHALLARQSAFSRRAVLSGGMPETGGKTDEQVLAANIETVFLVSGLDADFNLRRIERYLSAAWDSGAMPVIILNKADLCDDIDIKVQQIENIAIGVSIHVMSAMKNEGLESIKQYLGRGRTVAFMGSSGVGKSTIINKLLGEDRLLTQAVREDDSRGRHTTTYRQMILLPDGGIVIDTPGMRSFKVWDGDEGISLIFNDIEELALQCKFGDCSHQSEPECAIKAALGDGTLDPKRYESYLKLQKEKEFLNKRKNQKEIRKSEREWDKKIRNILKQRNDLKKKGLI